MAPQASSEAQAPAAAPAQAGPGPSPFGSAPSSSGPASPFQDQRELLSEPGNRALRLRQIADRESSIVKLRSGHVRLRGHNASSGEAPGHVLVQFARLPNQEQWSRIRAQDIGVSAYIPNRAFVLRLNRQQLNWLQDAVELEASGDLLPGDKLPAGFSTASIPEHARRGGNRAAVRVDFHETEAVEAARGELSRLGATIESGPAGFGGNLVVAANLDVLRQVAALDAVASVSFIPPAPELHNYTASLRSSVTPVREHPYGLDGSGINIGEWDGGSVAAEHPDFTGRVLNVEHLNHPHYHATHVAGTLMGAGHGTPSARGQAPKARLFAWDFAGDIVKEMLAGIATYGLRVSNHSYGFTPKCGTIVRQGQYTQISADEDRIAYLTDHMVVRSAGNNRNKTLKDECGIHAGFLLDGDYYQTIAEYASTKNSLVIGALEDDDNITVFSDSGPTDDGRLKPDLAANGSNLQSTNFQGEYLIISGTSMASPAVAGQVALLYDAFNRWAGTVPSHAYVKAACINATNDLIDPPHSNRGPDYYTGHGILDSLKLISAARISLETEGVPMHLEGSFDSSEETTAVTFTLSAARPELRFTLAWTDPPGSMLASPALVNDLDLRLIGPDGFIWKPFVLDPISPSTAATRRDNTRDSVEQVSITSAEAASAGASWAGTWTVVIDSVVIAEGPQSWALVTNTPLGFDAGSPPAITVHSPSGASASGTVTFVVDVIPSDSREILAVQYRLGTGNWLAMRHVGDEDQYVSTVDETVSSGRTTTLQFRATDSAGQTVEVTQSLTLTGGDDHPDTASSTQEGRDDLDINGPPRFGTINSGSDLDYFQFSVPAEDVNVPIQIETAEGTLRRTELTIYDEDGSNELASNVDARDINDSSDNDVSNTISRLTDFTPTSAGLYKIEVASTSTFIGTYSVRVRHARPVPRFLASPTTSGAATTVTFQNTSIGEFNSFRWLLGDGTDVTTQTAKPHFYTTGTYRVRMLAELDAGTVLAPTIDLVIGADAEDDHADSVLSIKSTSDFVTTHAPAFGELEASGDTDFFAVDLISGKTYEIQVSSSTSSANLLDPAVDLLGPFPFATLARNDDMAAFTLRARLVHTATSSGFHFVKVTSTDDETGGYTVTLRELESDLPDLEVDSVTILTGPTDSGTVQVAVQVTNSGPAAAGSRIAVVLHSSDNTAISDYTDTRVGSFSIESGLSSGQTVTVTSELSFRSSGTVFIGAIVDPLNVHAEENETNNVAVTSSTVVFTEESTPSNRPPLVRTIDEISVQQGETVTLSANTTDEDEDSLTYSWLQTTGPTVTLQNPATLTPSFGAATPGFYEFLITATDPSGAEGSDRLRVIVDSLAGKRLDSLSVTSATTRATRGDASGLLFVSTLRNSSARVLQIDSASLLFTQGDDDVSSAFAVTPVTMFPRSLRPGRIATASHRVNVGLSAPLGTIDVGALILGVDLSSAEAIENSTTTLRHALEVEGPGGALAFGPLQALARASTGQTFVATVAVQNTGVSTAGILASQLTFDPPGLAVTALPGQPSIIDPGAEGLFQFDVVVQPDATAGLRSGTLLITAQDLTTSASVGRSQLLTGSVQIQRGAQLQLTSVVAGAAQVLVGQTVPGIQLSVANGGGTTAVDIQVELRLSRPASLGSAILTSGPLSIPGGATATFSIDLTLSATAPPGRVFLDALVTARDENDPSQTTVADGATTTDSILILTPAALSVPASLLPSLLTRNTTAAATVTVANSGTSTATVLSADLGFSNDGVTATALTTAGSVPGSGSRTFNFVISTASQAATGTLTASLSVTAVDSTGGVSASTSAVLPAPLRVGNPPEIHLSAFRCDVTTLSTGQSVPATTSLSNSGEATALIDHLSLLFSAPGLAASTPATTVVLHAGATLDLPFRITATGPAGATSWTSATVIARDDDTGLGPLPVVNDASPIPFVVQDPPELTLLSVSLGRLSLARGSSTTSEVNIRNQGGAAARITAAIIGPPDSAIAVTDTGPFAPLILGAGETRRFRSGVITGISTGTITLSTATVTAVDVNSERSAGLSSNQVALPQVLRIGSLPIAQILSPSPRYSVDGSPARVSLDATSSASPEGGLLTYSWSALSGPSFVFTIPGTSVQHIELSTTARYGFQVEVTDAIGLTSTASTVIDVLTNSAPRVSVPPPQRVVLNSTVDLRGTATDQDNEALALRWDQIGGPASLLPLQGTTGSTSVTIAATEAGLFTFRFTARDSREGVAAATTSIEISTAVTGAITLGRGLNLISLPLEPLTTSGVSLTSLDLARLLSASVIVRTTAGPSDTSRFRTFIPGLSAPHRLRGGAAYLVIVKNRTGRVVLSGRAWPASSQQQTVQPPRGMAGYPGAVPAGARASDLLGQVGGRYLIRSRVDATGNAVWEAHLPGVSEDFELHSGEGYLLFISSQGNLILGNGPLLGNGP